MHVCSFVYVCFVFFSLVHYLEQHTVLYKVDRQNDDRHSPRVECRLLLTANEHARQLQARKRVNVVISDMDTSNTCDRPLVKFLWNSCCEWNCASHLFRKFQVNSPTLDNPKNKLLFYRLWSQYLFLMHLWISLLPYGTGSAWSKRENDPNISYWKLCVYGNIYN